MRLNHFRLLIAMLPVWALLWPAADTYGQFKKGKTFNMPIENEVSTNPTSYRTYEFIFPNINKITYFEDPALLKKLQKAEAKGDLDKSLPLLEQYVSQFGIQNFYYETRWLWKLGQLYMATGKNDKAKSLFRMVLKHHPGDINKVRRYYDSVSVGQTITYVPLNFYYELVEYRKHIDTLQPPRGVLLSMGDGINSSSADYGPALSAGDDTLIFTSKRKKHKGTNKPNEDLYFSKSMDGYFDESDPMLTINSEYNEGSAIFSRDGKHLYFSRCESPQGFGSCDIFCADWVANENAWGNIRNLGPGINSNGWDSQPALSASEDTMFFASDRLGGFGRSDIYYSVKLPGGEWGQAQNLGPTVNTRQNESSPFWHQTYRILYFSSNGHLVNFGGFDIYKSYFRNGHFQEPRNIGPLVNGKGNEQYFAIDGKSKNLYYARSEEADMNNQDLFSFPLPMEAQPLAYTAFHGSLTDSTGKPFQGIVSIIDLDHGVEVAPRALRADGSFDFDLIKNNNYLLVIQGDEFFRIQEMFHLNGDTTIERKTDNIRNHKIRFSDIEFAEGSDEILPSMTKDLDQVMNFLIDNPRFKLKISGHTDQVGDKKANLKLSLNRAQAIRKYLIESGKIREHRIEAFGYGDTHPIIPSEKTEDDRAINRRVEFEIVPPQ
ncbi:MAG: OmpA family protein [Bacteroidota bacterium]